MTSKNIKEKLVHTFSFSEGLVEIDPRRRYTIIEDKTMTKKEEPITHKTNEEIEAEVEVDLDEFMAAKKFNEDSPLQYTNTVKGKEEFDPRGFVGSAVKLFQTDYPKYRELMEKAGWTYEKTTTN